MPDALALIKNHSGRYQNMISSGQTLQLAVGVFYIRRLRENLFLTKQNLITTNHQPFRLLHGKARRFHLCQQNRDINSRQAFCCASDTDGLFIYRRGDGIKAQSRIFHHFSACQAGRGQKYRTVWQCPMIIPSCHLSDFPATLYGDGLSRRPFLPQTGGRYPIPSSHFSQKAGGPL